MIFVILFDKFFIICIKMNKGLVWCFFLKFWNVLIYFFEVLIVKIKYNIWFYWFNSEFDLVLGIEEVYILRKFMF